MVVTSKKFVAQTSVLHHVNEYILQKLPVNDNFHISILVTLLFDVLTSKLLHHLLMLEKISPVSKNFATLSQ